MNVFQMSKNIGRRQIDVQNFEKMTEPKFQPWGIYLLIGRLKSILSDLFSWRLCNSLVDY